jgi:myo-inositol-1(or 4)-monophosphatase
MTELKTVDVVIPDGAYDLTVALAKEAGAILRERVSTDREISFKGVVNLVTDADHASEALIASRLRETYPDHRLIGEEGSENVQAEGDAPYVWVFDPLDGTTNYAHGYPHFGVSIALYQRDVPLIGVVYDPMRDECFAAQRGQGATLNGRPMHVSSIDQLVQSLLASGFSYNLEERAENAAIWNDFLMTTQGPRRDGAAALNLVYVAAGRLDGFWERPLEVWDMAAGGLIVAEAGGTLSNYAGGPFDPFSRECVATNGHLHQPMLEVIQRHEPGQGDD